MHWYVIGGLAMFAVAWIIVAVQIIKGDLSFRDLDAADDVGDQCLASIMLVVVITVTAMIWPLTIMAALVAWALRRNDG